MRMNHRVSPEKARPGDKIEETRSSRTSDVEVKADESTPNNSQQTAQNSGGVDVGDMPGSDARINWENSLSECLKRSTGGTSDTNREAARALGEVGVLRSSVDLWESKTHGEPRRGTCDHATPSREGDGDGEIFSIRTPHKIRELQRALYRKAKANPKWRAYSLYGDLCRRDILEKALEQVVNKRGSPGVDGERVELLDVLPAKREEFLVKLEGELRSKQYRASPVRRVYIPKANGKLRGLGIPTVKDRVVQTAAVILLMPIFEADFHPHSYAYRPGKNAQQAMEAIKTAMRSRKTEVVDADLSAYFDTIPHGALLRLVSRRISDGRMLKLIRSWLKAPIVEEENKKGTRRVLPNNRGTPQGGVISPLLANAYLNGLDHAVNEKCELGARLVRYADDLVILCGPGKAAGLKTRLGRYLESKGLSLNEEKTRLVDTWKEGFEFLGYHVHWRQGHRGGKKYVHIEPSRKSCLRLRDRLRDELNHWTTTRSVEAAVERVNQVVRGWGGYFHYANSSEVFGKTQRWICNRFRRWLWKKCARTRPIWKIGLDRELCRKYGLYQLPLYRAN